MNGVGRKELTLWRGTRTGWCWLQVPPARAKPPRSITGRIRSTANALQGIIAQDLLPAADRTRRVLAYEMVMANGAVRNLIRENQVHQLENSIQTGRKEGMVLMDNCLYDLYCKCLITYDTALSRARHPERIVRNKL